MEPGSLLHRASGSQYTGLTAFMAQSAAQWIYRPWPQWLKAQNMANMSIPLSEHQKQMSVFEVVYGNFSKSLSSEMSACQSALNRLLNLTKALEPMKGLSS